jgi:hypothetical protein
LVRPTIISACFNPNASTAHFLSCSLLILVFTYHFLLFLISVFSFHLSLRWVLTAFFVSRAGYLRLQASLFLYFYSVLRDCYFLRVGYGG